jgi:hypothetical protein
MGGRVDGATKGCIDAFSSTIIDVDGDVPVLLNVPLTGGVCNYKSYFHGASSSVVPTFNSDGDICCVECCKTVLVYDV